MTYGKQVQYLDFESRAQASRLAKYFHSKVSAKIFHFFGTKDTNKISINASVQLQDTMDGTKRLMLVIARKKNGSILTAICSYHRESDRCCCNCVGDRPRIHWQICSLPCPHHNLQRQIGLLFAYIH